MASLRFTKFNLVRYSVIGGIAGIISFALAFIYQYIPLRTWYENKWVVITGSVVDVNIRNQILSQGYFPTLGLNILDFLQNNLMFNVSNFIGTIVGAIAILLLGRAVVGFLPQKKWIANARIILSFLVGIGLFSFIVTLAMGFPFITTFFSMLAYGLVLGIIMQLLVKAKSFRWISE